MSFFEEARKLFPMTQSHIYLAVAAANPGASPVVSAIRRFFEDLQSGKGRMEVWQEKVKETKGNIAKLICCDPDEICFVKNTSEGLNIAAQGIPLQRGENIIINDLENPNNIYNWLNLKKTKGVEVKIFRSKNCRLDPEEMVEAIDPKTRVVSLSHVTPYYGFRSDLARLSRVCKQKGLYLVVDGIQAVGVLATDVRKLGIDVLACGGHKGLLGTFGTGFLYLNRETCGDIAPPYLAKASVEGGSEFPYTGTLYNDARRFDIGNQNYPGIYGLNEGIRLILELGIQNIEKRVMRLTDLLIKRLREEDFHINSSLVREERSGIISFNISEPAKVQQLLRERNMITSLRRNAIRVSPHFYNTEEEMEKFMRGLIEVRDRIHGH